MDTAVDTGSMHLWRMLPVRDITLAHAIAILEVRYHGIYCDVESAVIPVRDRLASFIVEVGLDATVSLVYGHDTSWMTFAKTGIHPAWEYGPFEWVGIEETLRQFPWYSVWSVPCVRAQPQPRRPGRASRRG